MIDEAVATISVFLADDHPLVLEGMKALVAEELGFELVGEARDGATALRRAISLQPDVAVLDLSMPGLSGTEVARKLLEACPLCRVVILTVHDDGAYLRQVLDIGVAGYVLKRSATEDLRRAIHAVAAGGTYLDPSIAARAVGRVSRQQTDASDGASAELSARETEVLRMTALGHSNKSIANALTIGVKSVDTYKARAMEKLAFRNRVEVIRFALGKGWLNEC